MPNGHDYDLIVVGGGFGGLAAAKQAASLGAKVACFNFVNSSTRETKWGLGSTCVNIGCAAQRNVHYANLLGATCHYAHQPGWLFNPLHSWAWLMQTLANHITSINLGYRGRFSSASVTFINAQAQFSGTHSVTYSLQGVDKSLSAFYIIIDMVGHPVIPADIPGAKELAYSCDDVFSMTRPPGRTLCVGGGYVSLECAAFLMELGYPTTVAVESAVLKGFDQQFAEKVVSLLAEMGVRFIFYSTASQLAKCSSGQIQVTLVRPGTDEIVTTDIFDTVIYATERHCDLSGLHLEVAGVAVQTSGKIPVVEDHTNVPHIFVVGDCAQARQEVTAVAVRTGEMLARRLFGGSEMLLDVNLVPSTVFTPIEFANVSLSEDARVKIGMDDSCMPELMPLDRRDETLADDDDSQSKSFMDEPGHYDTAVPRRFSTSTCDSLFGGDALQLSDVEEEPCDSPRSQASSLAAAFSSHQLKRPPSLSISFLCTTSPADVDSPPLSWRSDCSSTSVATTPPTTDRTVSAGPSYRHTGARSRTPPPYSTSTPLLSSRGVVRSVSDTAIAPDYRNNPNLKPPYSYAALIIQALSCPVGKKLHVHEIYQWIADNYAYYSIFNKSWQNSIRHNLSLHKCFVKEARPVDDPGKGSLWTLDASQDHAYDGWSIGTGSTTRIPRRKPKNPKRPLDSTSPMGISEETASSSSPSASSSSALASDRLPPAMTGSTPRSLDNTKNPSPLPPQSPSMLTINKRLRNVSNAEMPFSNSNSLPVRPSTGTLLPPPPSSTLLSPSAGRQPTPRSTSLPLPSSPQPMDVGASDSTHFVPSVPQPVNPTHLPSFGPRPQSFAGGRSAVVVPPLPLFDSGAFAAGGIISPPVSAASSGSSVSSAHISEEFSGLLSLATVCGALASSSTTRSSPSQQQL
mmetsp:Transcript_15450/g.25535  ORF Transcript_15450/g.25535 Transcript_15450/m.25535 type:complete len:911 (+) Transcript_15450:268-3000(+)|eukprot:CAMPEP_0184658198 /NCGR_PEP_ID=MMETSP0308-20130426/24099_1 /TAXON_ID=38269 /ORGANISM="Gloeochaete witrockiana, Strain SAG 46.84" /LENGTH=910 /DNA_ID=CAMNT_0027096951 /DNA_START=191 /DNA_END=2923 /DNA_ORIENTATION=-